MRRGFLIGAFGAAALLILSLVQGATLLPGCGLRLGTSDYLNFCRDPAAAGPSPELAAELERHAALEDRLRDLERSLAGLGACPPPAIPAPEPEPEPDQLDAERWHEGDISLLEGCWSLASDYRLEDRESGTVTEVESWRMCFDAEGSGDQQLAQSNGATCEGEVTAYFDDDGRLRINDQANVQCTGSYIYRRVMTCTLEPNGEAACRSRQPERGQGASSVRIVRRESP